MTRRRLIILAGLAALVVVVAIGLAQSGGTKAPTAGAKDGSRLTVGQARRALADAPAPLAALYRDANRVLPASRAQVQRRIASLRGTPIVINKWASWCGPCRAEFPFLQSAATRLGRQVAFIGLNAGDNRANALSFLGRFPLPYPSLEDPDERAAFALGASSNFPITLFYDARGKQTFAHQGGYATQAALVEDVERYALGA
jgi:cytochrome c biogenesis protein CcmG/thiol:disulfide interchange protein DsbE